MFGLVTRAVLAALAIAIVGSTASAQAPVRLVLDFAIQGQQSPFVLGADEGIYKKAGVNVQVDRGYGSGDAITKVAGGAYDMAFADLGALIQFNGREKTTKLISVFQVYDVAPMVIIATKKSGIVKPGDLAGKKIASPPGASSRLMFPLFAAANSFDPNSVQWLDVTPQLRETLLVQGQTDAVTAIITDLAGLRRLLSDADLTVMRFSDYGVNLYGHGLLTTPEFAAKNPDAIRAVIKGTVEAWKAAIANPARSIAALTKRDPLVDEAVDRARLELVINNNILTDHVKKNGFSAVDMGRMKQTIDMVTTTFKTPPIEPASIYRDTYLPPRNELMIQ
jgi:NitT/TauT family transport system substrate-binding protein